MRTVKKNSGWLMLALVVALTSVSSFAADKPAKDQSRRLQQQLRQAEQEKAQLTRKVAEAEAQVKEMEEKVAEIQLRADAAASRIARLGKELDAMRAQAAKDKAEQAALTAKLAETERNLAETKRAFAAEKQQLESAAAHQRKVLADCSERNGRMYKLGNELLDKYEEKSCFTSVLQLEPFTGLKRAQIEKMAEEDREKLDRDQLNP